ncbi:MAG: S1 RNA-binding domain-containing protein [bacterium]|nr:S1 RNA-binding domain-containing protein [bacterium]
MSVQEGDKVKGVVSDVTHFGAFVKLETGEKGLIHISEIANSYVKNVSDHLKIGDEVTVKVIAIKDRGKIDLSIRRLNEEGTPVPRGPQGRGPQSQRPQSRGPQSRGPQSRGPQGRKPFSRGSQSQSFSGDNFEDKLSFFMKKSQEKLSDAKKRKEKRSRGRRK